MIDCGTPGRVPRLPRWATCASHQAGNKGPEHPVDKLPLLPSRPGGVRKCSVARDRFFCPTIPPPWPVRKRGLAARALATQELDVVGRRLALGELAGCNRLLASLA